MGLRRSIFELLWVSPVKSVLERVPVVRRTYDGWKRQHPFDAAQGVDTSGSIESSEVGADPVLAADASVYGGSQPSIVRRSLEQLPEPSRYAFADIGCGKGRPLLVASELAFARLVGVEMSAALAEVARANAAVLGRKFPARRPIEVQVGNATALVPPASRTVYFLYHPFGRAQVRALADNITAALGGALEQAFIVYYNPVHAAALDALPQLARYSAETLAYAPEELGFGPDLDDTVVVWQTRPEQHPARGHADRKVLVDAKGSRATLEG